MSLYRLDLDKLGLAIFWAFFNIQDSNNYILVFELLQNLWILKF